MSSTPQPVPPPLGGKTGSVFVGPSGIRAGWRLLLFFVVFVAVLALLQLAAIEFIPSVKALLLATQKQQSGLTPTGLIAVEATNLLATLLAIFAMSKIESRRIPDYGFRAPSGDAGRRFGEGLIWGVAMVVAICSLLRIEGHFWFGPLALRGAPALRYGLLWALGTLMVGFFEETFFRGYSQSTLASGIGFWPSAFVLSGVFGLTHLSDRGYTGLGVVTAALFGVLSCLSLRRTGSLWLGIGFHAAFDFSETYLFSPPNGGIASVSSHLFSSSISGPSWLTGGGTGVEGSVNGLAIFAIIFLLFNWIHPARKVVTG
ncbi:MAG TPA: CPBP family intramembrane glutamic endopeptidase [Candidatus Acidoferrum sp.]|nr:CPBP family intramembrane glutamic endopeptidase [Candidatus Acidoferrum sp.]